jgi:hypothetical protein
MNNIPYEKEISDKMNLLFISSNKRRRVNEDKEDNSNDRKKIVKKGIYKRYNFVKIDTSKVPSYIL